MIGTTTTKVISRMSFVKVGKRNLGLEWRNPPVHELEFLKISKNHGELSNKLSQLGVPSPDILEYAKHVCMCWYKLSEDHLQDAKAALAAKAERAVFSRSYYAVYNASKSVRYVVEGFVSLNGDDHKRAGSLPDDFPDVVDWSASISSLYQHRLRADYENWADTAHKQTLPTEDAVTKAEKFMEVAKAYMQEKYGVVL